MLTHLNMNNYKSNNECDTITSYKYNDKNNENIYPTLLYDQVYEPMCNVRL